MLGRHWSAKEKSRGQTGPNATCRPAIGPTTGAHSGADAGQPPQVTFQNGLLAISADNSNLADVLRGVRSALGIGLDTPLGAGSERVVVHLGPGQPRDVLTQLFNGSRYDYILVGTAQDPQGISQVILTPRQSSAVAGNMAQPTPAQPAIGGAVTRGTTIPTVTTPLNSPNPLLPHSCRQRIRTSPIPRPSLPVMRAPALRAVEAKLVASRSRHRSSCCRSYSACSSNNNSSSSNNSNSRIVLNKLRAAGAVCPAPTLLFQGLVQDSHPS